MNNPLCKYCGKPMMIDIIDHYDTWYICKCDGYLKEEKLKNEIIKIECDLKNKKIELENHKKNNLYNCSIRELENKIKKIKQQYDNK